MAQYDEYVHPSQLSETELRPRSKRGCLIAVGLVVCVLLFSGARLLTGFTPWQLIRSPFRPSPAQLIPIGEPIVAAIEVYRLENGRYPTSLAEAGLDPDPTFYGDWKYIVIGTHGGRQLSNGEYGRYWFIVFWTPDHGWHIDS